MQVNLYRLFPAVFLLIFLFCTGAEVLAQANAGQDREICIYDTLRVTGSGLNPGDTGSYRWRDIGTNTVLSANENLELKILSISQKQFELRLLVIKNGQNILSYDTFTLKVNALPVFTYAGIPPRCYNDGAISLTASCAVRARSGDLTRSSCDPRYYQKKSPSWISGAPSGPYVYDFSKYISNTQIPRSGAKDSICYDYTDYKGCYNSACKAIVLYPSPVVELQDGVFTQCDGLPVLDKLAVKPFNKTGGIQTFTCLSVPAGSGLDPSAAISIDNSVSPPVWVLNSGTVNDPQLTGVYRISYCFKDAITGCMTCDTANVEILVLPQPDIRKLPSMCLNDDTLQLDTFVKNKSNGLVFTGGKWSCIEFNGSRDTSISSVKIAIEQAISDNGYFYFVSGSGSYLLKFTDTSSGCGYSDSAFVNVYGLPIIVIDVPDTVAATGGLVPLKNTVPAGPVGTWSGPGVLGRDFDPSVSPQTKLFEGPYQVKYTYTHPLVGCTSSDSQSILVQSPPRIDLQASLAKVSGVFEADFSGSSREFTDSSFQKSLWNFGNGKSSSFFNPGKVYYSDSGTYTVRQTIWDSRYTTSDTLILVFDYTLGGTSLEELMAGLEVYPNPVKDRLYIRLDTEAELSITDLLGKMHLQAFKLKPGENTVALDHLEKGVYMIQISRPGIAIKKTILLH